MGNIWSRIADRCKCPSNWLETPSLADEHNDKVRNRGGQRLQSLSNTEEKQAEDLINYFSAHGGYTDSTIHETVKIPGLAVIFLTSIGSSIAVELSWQFTRLPTAKKVEALQNPSAAIQLFHELEIAYTGYLRKEVGIVEPSPNRKKDFAPNRLQMVPYTYQVPNMRFSLLGEAGEFFFPSGLLDKHTIKDFNVHRPRSTVRVALGLEPWANLEDVTINMVGVDELIRELMPNPRYVAYFTKKLKWEQDYGQYDMSLDELLTIDLFTLQEQGLLPEKGVLFILACRDCSKVTDRNTVESRLKKDRRTQDLGDLIAQPLSQICSKIPCAKRIMRVDMSGSGDMHPNNICKKDGCSECDLIHNQCRSCEETKAILIYPNNDSARCLMCFTVHEIMILADAQLDLRDKDLKILADIPGHKSLTNPIYKECKIDIRILKIILGWLYGNSNQEIFTHIDNIEQAIEFLGVLASFKFVVSSSGLISKEEMLFLVYIHALLNDMKDRISFPPATLQIGSSNYEVNLVFLVQTATEALAHMIKIHDLSQYIPLMNHVIESKELLERMTEGKRRKLM